ncbi:hypothetical protein N7475_000496 [Penicillium sp. IBT 31633x]|nr:hypothetical protein N7475_000496 [Penicillium sp. IBT 31633x]
MASRNVVLRASAIESLFHPLGIRVIAPERPGFGLSTVQPNRRIMGWPADIQALARHLSLSRFAILGGSGGGPYALACAQGLPQDMMSAVGVIAGAGNQWIRDFLQKDQKQHNTPINERTAEFIRILFEPFAQGAGPAAYEAKLLSQDWGIDFGNITYNNLRIWHAGKDWNSPLPMTEYYVKLLPNRPYFKVFEDDTHFTMHRNLQKILSELVPESSKQDSETLPRLIGSKRLDQRTSPLQ